MKYSALLTAILTQKKKRVGEDVAAVLMNPADFVNVVDELYGPNTDPERVECASITIGTKRIPLFPSDNLGRGYVTIQ